MSVLPMHALLYDNKIIRHKTIIDTVLWHIEKNLLIEISLEIFHFIKGILEKLARMRFRKFS